MTGTDKELEIVPARQGKAAFVKAGEAITIINTHGTQVVDTWCFMTDNLAEFMSSELPNFRGGILRGTTDLMIPNPEVWS